MAEHVELRIEPASERFDADDDRWVSQAAAFNREFATTLEGVRREQTSVTGTKGALESVILSLTSAGAMTAAAEFFKAWIGRGADRRVKVTFGESGGLQEFEFAGSDLDEATLHQVMAALNARLSP
jgi:hypothetical protein